MDGLVHLTAMNIHSNAIKSKLKSLLDSQYQIFLQSRINVARCY